MNSAIKYIMSKGKSAFSTAKLRNSKGDIVAILFSSKDSIVTVLWSISAKPFSYKGEDLEINSVVVYYGNESRNFRNAPEGKVLLEKLLG